MSTKIPILFELLKSRGISQKQLAQNTGISPGNISDWKSGKAAPSQSALSKIAKYLNCSVDYLLGTENEIDDTPATERQLKFALFGTADIDDSILEDVKQIAKVLAKKKDDENEGGNNDKT